MKFIPSSYVNNYSAIILYKPLKTLISNAVENNTYTLDNDYTFFIPLHATDWTTK